MVRFTDAEYASISISAEQAGYPVAVYVRKSALDERIEVHYNITAELPELQKLIAEYSAIGNNLNQIAQYFHSGGFYSKSMQDEINRHLTALWQLRQEAIKLGGTYHGRVKTHRNKNADYSAAVCYLKYQHDERHLKPLLDENGSMMLRSEFHMNGVNCNPDTFDLECEMLNDQYVHGIQLHQAAFDHLFRLFFSANTQELFSAGHGFHKQFQNLHQDFPVMRRILL